MNKIITFSRKAGKLLIKLAPYVLVAAGAVAALTPGQTDDLVVKILETLSHSAPDITDVSQ